VQPETADVKNVIYQQIKAFCLQPGSYSERKRLETCLSAMEVASQKIAGSRPVKAVREVEFLQPVSLRGASENVVTSGLGHLLVTQIVAKSDEERKQSFVQEMK
jgi:hypothetical protein